MEGITPGRVFVDILGEEKTVAKAWIRGNSDNPKLGGLIQFFKTGYGGVLVQAEVFGLPKISESATDFFAMHIHENGDCTLPFDKTGGHYNPYGALHPYHAGDMPPLMGNDGYGWMSFFDTRFTVEEILGKSVIIHKMRDDFTSQPSGNAGEKIGCGVIVPVKDV